MPTVLQQALIFLSDTIFGIYLYILILRLILVWVHADYSLPITQFIIKTTSFLVRPLRQVFPDVRRTETATIVLILLVSMIKQVIHISFTFGLTHVFSVFGILLLSVVDPIECLITILSIAILFQALLSWIQPHTQINHVLYQVTSPILRPIQRIVPPISGIDISPIIALILLQLVMILFVIPLLGEGASLTIS